MGSGGISPSLAGTEVDSSRRYLYVADAQLVRLSYMGGGLGDCALSLEHSIDSGATWATTIPYGPNLGSSAGVVLSSEWTELGDLVWLGDLLVRVVARGAALSLGLLYQLRMVELQVR